MTRRTQILIGAAAVIAGLVSCSRNDVGDEKNNPAPSSNYSLTEAQQIGDTWAREDLANRRWSTPTPTSSMVPYVDSHSVMLLESVKSPVRLHDILIVNEGVGRENVCHQVTKLSGDSVYVVGKNNKWPDGWMPLSAVKWRVAGVIYTRG